MTIVLDATPNMLPNICRRLAERMIIQFDRGLGAPASTEEKKTIRNAYRMLVMHQTRQLNVRAPTGVVGAMTDIEAEVEDDADISDRVHASIQKALDNSFASHQDTVLQEMEMALGALAGRADARENIDQTKLQTAKKFFVELKQSLT